MLKTLSIVGLSLLISFFSMQFTTKINWSIFDFIIMGILLSITAILIHTVNKKIKYYRYKKIFITVVVMIFILIWAELGVGLFGTTFAGD